MAPSKVVGWAEAVGVEVTMLVGLILLGLTVAAHV